MFITYLLKVFIFTIKTYLLQVDFIKTYLLQVVFIKAYLLEVV
jgi:hypothetical protein